MRYKKANIFKIQAQRIFIVNKCQLWIPKTIQKTLILIWKNIKVSIMIRIFRVAKVFIRKINIETHQINQYNINFMKNLKSKNLKKNKIAIIIQRLKLSLMMIQI